jgi:predicted RNA-binding protein with PIN domain
MPYLVDGNNLLGSWGGPRGENGRAEVVRRVAAFCRAKGARATIVFDGGPLRPDMAEQSLGPVSIRVPPEGRDADSVIRRIVEESSAPGDLVVVTSDKALYSYVKTLGASVLRAHEWNALDRQSAPPAREGAEKPDHESDVEGWLKRFGGDR